MTPSVSFLRMAAFAAVVTLSGAGCANYAAPFERTAPGPAAPTATNSALKELPAPQEQVVAAVYRFRDQTGQYKATEVASSFSTAVTQGSTSILMRALEDSGWFVPIEREGLSNLLNERQIIQSIRAQYEGPDGEPLGPLPPLLYAGIMLEGGIVGYDTNVLTGGAGVRYLGAGGSGQFRQDQVTVYLRAVSTQTGRVLKTVYTTKTIISQQTDVGLFRFVDTERLLEAEVGYSYNEPPVVAVTEAIEDAVRSLVLEGVREGLWGLANEADREHSAFQAYDRSLQQAERRDVFGQIATEDRSGFSLKASAGARRYQGNYERPLVRPSLDVSALWMRSPRWGVGIAASTGEIAAEGVFETRAASVEARSLYHMLPSAYVSPFLQVGAGIMKPDLSASGTTFGEELFPYVSLGGGVEYLLSPSVGLNLTLLNQYALQDGIDGVTEGSGNDSVWNLTAGFTWYTGGPR